MPEMFTLSDLVFSLSTTETLFQPGYRWNEKRVLNEQAEPGRSASFTVHEPVEIIIIIMWPGPPYQRSMKTDRKT